VSGVLAKMDGFRLRFGLGDDANRPFSF